MKTNNHNHMVRLLFAGLSAWLTAFLFLMFTVPVQATVPLVQNGGFETGSFSSWTLSGNTGDTYVTTNSSYVHSGTYGAELGPVGSLGYLSQTLATVPGQSYLLSFWVDNFGNTNNEFSVAWNGSTLYDQTNLPAFGWSNYVFTVTATNTSTVLQLGFRNDPNWFGLDDISVTPLCAGLTFDTLAAGAVPAGYGGLNWNNFTVYDGVGSVSGYGAGVVSTNNIAYNGGGGAASITSTNPFNLFSAYLTAAWNDNLQVEAKGYANGVLIYDNTYTLSATNPTLINFNYLGVTEVDFTASGGTPHGYAGSGTEFVMDNVNAATGPGVKSGPQIAVPLPGPLLGQSAYVRSTSGEPWSVTDNDAAMNSVFGSNVWHDLRYETVNPAVLFSPAMHFIFLEGSDNNANALNTFLAANLSAMQSWVSNGGSLFINAAPNEGGNINFGFGVTLNYGPLYSSSGTAVAPVNPIFNGPFTPVGTYWTGSSFSHATVSGTGLIPLIINTNNGSIVLGEMAAGSGHVLFGGMTVPYWQSPSPQAANLRANILAYGNANPQCTFDDLPDTASGLPVPSGYRGFNWNNFYYIDGAEFYDYPNGYAAGAVSTNNVAYNGGATPANVTSATGSHFNFISAELTAAWNDNLQLEAQGYVDGVLTYDQTYTLSATAPTLIVFDYLGVTEVNFISSGGRPHAGYSGSGTHFAMDNVTMGAVISPVIQPFTLFTGGVSLTWNTFVNVPYQVQYKTNLTQVGGWLNLGSPITASGSTVTISNSIGSDPMRFYRVVLLP
jgi:hypothetical protein